MDRILRKSLRASTTTNRKSDWKRETIGETRRGKHTKDCYRRTNQIALSNADCEPLRPQIVEMRKHKSKWSKHTKLEFHIIRRQLNHVHFCVIFFVFFLLLLCLCVNSIALHTIGRTDGWASEQTAENKIIRAFFIVFVLISLFDVCVSVCVRCAMSQESSWSRGRFIQFFSLQNSFHCCSSSYSVHHHHRNRNARAVMEILYFFFVNVDANAKIQSLRKTWTWTKTRSAKRKRKTYAHTSGGERAREWDKTCSMMTAACARQRCDTNNNYNNNTKKWKLIKVFLFRVFF